MLVKPTVSSLLKKADNRYELVNMVSKRARQLVNGKEKLVKTEELSPISIATIEVDEDKVFIVNKETENEA